MKLLDGFVITLAGTKFSVPNRFTVQYLELKISTSTPYSWGAIMHRQPYTPALDERLNQGFIFIHFKLRSSLSVNYAYRLVVLDEQGNPTTTFLLVMLI